MRIGDQYSFEQNSSPYSIIDVKSSSNGTIGIAQKQNHNYVFKIVEDFHREVKAMQQLENQKYITKMIDHFSIENKQPYTHIIIIEPGICDLRQYLDLFKNDQLTDENLYSLIISILYGVKAMHSKKIMHRDLKPHNIFIFSDKENVTIEELIANKKLSVYAKIGDFGSSRIIRKNTKLTAGNLRGTIEYQCPELILDCKQYDYKIDIWTLGLTLYQIYTKKMYSDFYKKNANAVKSQQGTQKIRNFLTTELENRLPKNQWVSKIITIVQNCMRFNPKQRWQIQQIIKIFETCKKQPVKINVKKDQKKLKSLSQRLQNEVRKKINSYMVLKNKMDRLMETTIQSKKIRMKSAIIANLEREQKQYECMINKCKEIENCMLETIDMINQGEQKQIIQENQQKIQGCFTDMVTTLNNMRKNQSKKLDICFMIDGTGSMQKSIAAVRENIQKISNFVKDKFQPIRFAIVIYRDFSDKEQQFQIKPFTTAKDCIEILMKTEAKGGGDYAEDINGAFQEIIKLDWKSYTKVILHFTDAPCHYKDYNNLKTQLADNYLNKYPPNHLSYTQIFKQFKSSGINYFLVPIVKKNDQLIPLKFMYDKYVKIWNDALSYRATSSVYSQILYLQKAEIENFLGIIERSVNETKMITNKSIKIKRRGVKQGELLGINADDQINFTSQFTNL